ncbi:MAG: hypothetical protein JWO92_1307 [Chitinophagaceae bacterium]|nr:hypothetical protein [Chitinophagaceae bacterium]MDB5221383.1 hypothetical protein [Chitinophagaceae bacterium]
MRNLLILIIISTCFISCGSSTKLSEDATDNRKTVKWYKSKSWLNGLQLIPHKSINQQEFSKQYHKNNVWWNKAFEFLKTHDLNNLKPGNYDIEPGNVYAIVSELSPKEKDKVGWEGHRDFNDIQYIIKGKTQMGVASINHPGTTVSVPYSGKADTETFSVAEGKYYDAEPGTFFIFSPQEIHRPAFKVAGYDLIKKIVIKVRVP